MPNTSPPRVLPALALLLTACLTACGPATFVVGVSPGGQALTATPVERDGRMGSSKIVIIDVNGMIANANQGGLLSAGENPVATLDEKLHAAQADPKVKAVILRINSPGGTVTASDMMYRQVNRFREASGKPVIVLMTDVAASGGYYLSCAGDHIIAYPTTITGSIGVVMQTFSIKPALSKIGIQAQALVGGPNKTAGSPFETLSPDQQQLLQAMVDEFYEGFQNVVREARPDIPADQWDNVTDGRVVTGIQALDVGLVDQLGDIHDAFAKAKALADISRADLWIYHRPLDYVASPYARSNTTPTGDIEINLLHLDLSGMNSGLNTPVGLYYLWRPDLQ